MTTPRTGENEPEDVVRMKRRLGVLGEMDGPDDKETGEFHPFLTREMDSGIRSTQRRFGLKEDGIARPGGETDRTTLLAVAQLASDEPRRQRILGVDSTDAGHVHTGATITDPLPKDGEEFTIRRNREERVEPTLTQRLSSTPSMGSIRQTGKEVPDLQFQLTPRARNTYIGAGMGAIAGIPGGPPGIFWSGLGGAGAGFLMTDDEDENEQENPIGWRRR